MNELLEGGFHIGKRECDALLENPPFGEALQGVARSGVPVEVIKQLDAEWREI